MSLYSYVGSNSIRYSDDLGLLFGFDAGEGYGSNAAQYWADRQVQTGNPLYYIPGLAASLWTPCTSNQTFINLIAPTTAGKALPALAKELLPRTMKGSIGEGLSFMKNLLGGNKYLGKGIRPKGTTTVADSAWLSADGAEYYVESKFGTAGLTKAQRAAQALLGDSYRIERWTYGWIGDNIGKPLGTFVGAVSSALGPGCTCGQAQ